MARKPRRASNASGTRPPDRAGSRTPGEVVYQQAIRAFVQTVLLYSQHHDAWNHIILPSQPRRNRRGKFKTPPRTGRELTKSLLAYEARFYPPIKEQPTGNPVGVAARRHYGAFHWIREAEAWLRGPLSDKPRHGLANVALDWCGWTVSQLALYHPSRYPDPANPAELRAQYIARYERLIQSLPRVASTEVDADERLRVQSERLLEVTTRALQTLAANMYVVNSDDFLQYLEGPNVEVAPHDDRVRYRYVEFDPPFPVRKVQHLMEEKDFFAIHAADPDLMTFRADGTPVRSGEQLVVGVFLYGEGHAPTLHIDNAAGTAQRRKFLDLDLVVDAHALFERYVATSHGVARSIAIQLVEPRSGVCTNYVSPDVNRVVFVKPGTLYQQPHGRDPRPDPPALGDPWRVVAHERDSADVKRYMDIERVRTIPGLDEVGVPDDGSVKVFRYETRRGTWVALGVRGETNHEPTTEELAVLRGHQQVRTTRRPRRDLPENPVLGGVYAELEEDGEYVFQFLGVDSSYLWERATRRERQRTLEQSSEPDADRPRGSQVRHTGIDASPESQTLS